MVVIKAKETVTASCLSPLDESYCVFAAKILEFKQRNLYRVSGDVFRDSFDAVCIPKGIWYPVGDLYNIADANVIVHCWFLS